MRAQDIIRLLQIRPFRPFRITLTDGAQFEIRHPDLALVDRWTVTIGLPSPKGLAEPLEGKVEVALPHITRTEPINGRLTTRRRKR